MMKRETMCCTHMDTKHEMYTYRCTARTQCVKYYSNKYLDTFLAGESKLNRVSSDPTEGVDNDITPASLSYVLGDGLWGHRVPALYNNRTYIMSNHKSML